MIVEVSKCHESARLAGANQEVCIADNPLGKLSAKQSSFVGPWRTVAQSGTSIGANYREAAKASSKKYFAAILAIASREANETLYWLELLAESETVKPELLSDITGECNELVAIFTASVKTAQEKIF
ncbi:MAG: four helix bundle protein [Pirellulales bacterium]|nr:four helix bundle protein [Pirellulales bacterium]